MQTKAGVASLDLSTGDLRWLRTESAPMLDGFGDERHLYLVESHAAGDVRGVRAVRTADGAAVPIPDCVDAYNHKLRTLGRLPAGLRTAVPRRKCASASTTCRRARTFGRRRSPPTPSFWSRPSPSWPPSPPRTGP